MVLDDVRLHVRGEGTGDGLTLEGHRVVGDGDVLGAQLAGDHHPDDDADDDEGDAAEDAENASDLDDPHLLLRGLESVRGGDDFF